MRNIGESENWTFLGSEDNAIRATPYKVRHGPGHTVETFLELATKVAELQFRNVEHVLLFRGQSTDHRDIKKKTTLRPSLFRTIGHLNPSAPTLVGRFKRLQRAERELVAQYRAENLIGLDQLIRHRIIRWSILQHYEVCPTPLLDVTHSLRIAASFASSEARPWAYVYVLGVPNLSGAITASAEASLQIVRLSSVCPPSAVRPHIQEGYLLGEYPEMGDFDQKEHYKFYEIDFGRRLVAKFRFDPEHFWNNGSDFPRVSRAALYPDGSDPMQRLAKRVKNSIAK